MDTIYLDNNATTRPAPEVIQAMQKVHEELWANPSSMHRFGQMVRHRMELARVKVAHLINCQERELIFTSGGTEANHLALHGVLDRTVIPRRDGASPLRGLLVTAETEHVAIREPAQRLEQWGVKVVYLSVDQFGQVNPAELASILDEYADETCLPLVSVHWANNEIGVIQPIEKLATVCQSHARERRGPPVLFHVDATQAVGKIPVDVKGVPVDLLTLSAHKFHGPKGIGALYVRDGVRLTVQHEGGPQERSRRGGTENTAGIIGFAVAAELACDFLTHDNKIQSMEAMRDHFEAAVQKLRPGTAIHAKDLEQSSPSPPLRLWNTTNVGFQHLQAEAILLGLSERGVCASAGAACSSGSLEPSPILLAMGVPEPVAHGSIRFSLSRYTSEKEMRRVVPIIGEVVDKLAKTLPLGI